MATYNFFDGSIEGQMVPPKAEIGTNQITIQRNIVDFSRQNIAVGDIAEVLSIPEGTTVLSAGIRIITGEASTSVDIGVTGDDPDKWGAGLSGVNADAVLGLLNSAKYFDADDTIDITPTAATAAWTGLKVEVFATCIKSVDQY